MRLVPSGCPWDRPDLNLCVILSLQRSGQQLGPLARMRARSARLLLLWAVLAGNAQGLHTVRCQGHGDSTGPAMGKLGGSQEVGIRVGMHVASGDPGLRWTVQ